jgi:hypothetical protein
MEHNLKKAFNDYLGLIQKKIVKCKRDDKTTNVLNLIINKSLEIRDLIAKTENHPYFKKLIEHTENTFHKRARWADAVQMSAGRNFGAYIYETLLCECAVQNYFRKSGCYNDIYNNKQIEAVKLYEKYCDSFKQQTIIRTYLAALDRSIRFKNNPSMDFEEFRLQSIPSEELNKLLNNEINRIFYPWAVINSDLIEKDYFLIIKKEYDISDLERLEWAREDYSIKPHQNIPKTVLSVLSPIVLYNWHSSTLPVEYQLELIMHSNEEYDERGEPSGDESWTNIVKKAENSYGFINYDFIGFEFPYILIVDDHLLSFPLKQNLPEKIADSSIFYPDDTPIHYFDEEKTEKFKNFVIDKNKLLDNLGCDINNQWNFLDRAVSYLIKAFFSHGLEQLLWNITVLEALVGERPDIQSNLARRVSIILCDTEAKRKELRKIIYELYDYRSRIIHGDKGPQGVYSEHLSLARHLARKTLLWFIHYLHYLKSTNITKNEEDLPTREDILMMIDLKENKQRLIRNLLDNVPDGFPNIKSWVN